MAEKSWNDSLDEMLDKLNNGDFTDQSVNEFSKVVDDTVLGSNNRTTYRSSSNNTARTTYRVVVPHVDRSIENTKYSSRYLQVVNCLENIVYDNYPSDKCAGYQRAIEQYLNEIKTHQNSFKEIDQQIDTDMHEYKQKVKASNVDTYLLGYYDALLMIKRVLNNSKLARLQELANKVGI